MGGYQGRVNTDPLTGAVVNSATWIHIILPTL